MKEHQAAVLNPRTESHTHSRRRQQLSTVLVKINSDCALFNGRWLGRWTPKATMAKKDKRGKDCSRGAVRAAQDAGADLGFEHARGEAESGSDSCSSSTPLPPLPLPLQLPLSLSAPSPAGLKQRPASASCAVRAAPLLQSFSPLAFLNHRGLVSMTKPANLKSGTNVVDLHHCCCALSAVNADRGSGSRGFGTVVRNSQFHSGVSKAFLNLL